MNLGGDVNCKNGHGKSILHEAAWFGRTDCLRVLITKDAVIDILSEENETPLHYAALSNKPESCEYLITKGADKNWKRLDGSTPLHHAAWGGYLQVAKCLLKYGADVNIVTEGGDRHDALQNAVCQNKPDLVSCILEHGKCDLEYRNKQGRTAEEMAKELEYPEVIEKFHEHVSEHEYQYLKI